MAVKRMLPAAVLAIGIHGVFLSSDAFRLHKVFTIKPEPQMVTLTLTYKTTPKPVLKSSSKTSNLSPLPAVPFKPILKPIHNPTKQRPLTPTPHKKVKPIPLTVPKNFRKPTAQPKPVKLDPEALRRFRMTGQMPKKISVTRKLRPAPAAKPRRAAHTVLSSAAPEKPPSAAIVDRQASPVPSKVTHADTSPVVSKSVPAALTEARPLYKENPAPRYPRIARRRGYQGTVILEVLVNRNGKVGDVRVFRSSGYSVLDRAATESVKEWVFQPGKRGKQTVDMWVRIPVRFQLE